MKKHKLIPILIFFSFISKPYAAETDSTVREFVKSIKLARDNKFSSICKLTSHDLKSSTQEEMFCNTGKIKLSALNKLDSFFSASIETLESSTIKCDQIKGLFKIQRTEGDSHITTHYWDHGDVTCLKDKVMSVMFFSRDPFFQQSLTNGVYFKKTLALFGFKSDLVPANDIQKIIKILSISAIALKNEANFDLILNTFIPNILDEFSSEFMKNKASSKKLADSTFLKTIQKHSRFSQDIASRVKKEIQFLANKNAIEPLAIQKQITIDEFKKMVVLVGEKN